MRHPPTVAEAPPPEEPSAAEDVQDERPSVSPWRSTVEWVVIIAGALVVAIVVRSFLFGAFFIPSGSMESTLNINDRVLVNKLSYKAHPIHRGDIIVFRRPPAEQVGNIKDLIKRVVAIQGDTVEVANDHVILNGRQLDEPYVHGLATTPLSLYQVCPPDAGRPQTCKVPAHQILVMGDNRTNSSDGRVFGPIDTKLVVGRAFVRIWPIGDISLL